MATIRVPADASSFTPSWFDALTDWIDAGPARRYGVYAAISLASVALVLAPGLVSATDADRRLVPFHLVLANTAAYMLLFMHLTKRWLGTAHERLRGTVDLAPDAFELWGRRIITTPAGPTLAVGVVGGAGIALLLLPLVRRPDLGLFGTPVAAAAHGALLGLTSFVIATYLCRAAYRTVASHRLHTRYLKVDLLRPEPLFGQTGVLARGSFTLIVYSSLWILTAPGAFESPGFVVVACAVNGFAVLLYVIPLFRFHRMLAAEKRRSIVAVHERARATSGAVHEALRTERWDVVDPLGKGLAALQTEVALLERVSTWPWHPELSRVTVTALLLPTALWVIQRILQAWL